MCFGEGLTELGTINAQFIDDCMSGSERDCFRQDGIVSWKIAQAILMTVVELLVSVCVLEGLDDSSSCPGVGPR